MMKFAVILSSLSLISCTLFSSASKQGSSLKTNAHCSYDASKNNVNFGEVTKIDPTTGKEIRVRQIGIAGYGSLTSARSIANSIGQDDYKVVMYPFKLNGWTRAWSAAMPNKYFYYVDNENKKVVPENIIYLNAERKKGSSMNGFVFIATEDMLPRFDSREWIYERVDVTNDFDDLSFCNGIVYLYTAKPRFTTDSWSATNSAVSAIRGSYVKILKDAIDSIEPESLKNEYAEQYLATTQPIPNKIVVEDVRDENECNPIYNTRNGVS